MFGTLPASQLSKCPSHVSDAAVLNLLFQELLGSPTPSESATSVLRDVARAVAASDAQEASALSISTAGASGVTVLDLLFLGCLRTMPESTSSELKCVARDADASDTGANWEFSNCMAGASRIMSLDLLFLDSFVLKVAPESASSEVEGVAADSKESTTQMALVLSDCTTGSSAVAELACPFLDLLGRLSATPESATSEFEGMASDEASDAWTASEFSNCTTAASGVTMFDLLFLETLRLDTSTGSTTSGLKCVASNSVDVYTLSGLLDCVSVASGVAGLDLFLLETLIFNESPRFVTSELKGVAAGTDPSDIWAPTTVLLDDSLALNVGGLPRSATRLSVVDLSGLTKPTTRGRVLVVEITPCLPWIRIDR